MSAVIGALAPVFMLIALGLALRRILLTEEAQWLGLERIVYYVLFPALLIVTLGRADLDNAPVFDVGGALFAATVIVCLLCLALRPLLAARFAIKGPAFSSIFQGATRYQTYIALSVAGTLYGTRGLTLASVATVAMVPVLNVFSVTVMTRYALPQRLPLRVVVVMILRNPLIWACLIGIVISASHVPIPPFIWAFGDALGRASLAVGLIVTGAGLQPSGLWRLNTGALVAVVLKLAVMPALAALFGIGLGLERTSLAVIVCCAAVPTSSSAYVLARQMGGDAPLLAQIITVQTALAAVTMPLALALVG